MSDLLVTPVADGLFTIEAGTVRLIGSRCRSCGSDYFPQSPSCRNPGCAGKAVERASLDPHGTLHSWTVQAYRPPPPFRMDEWAPYAIGLVDMPNGLRVLGMIDGCPPDDIRIDMPLRVSTRVLHADEAGRPVHTYCFVPDSAEALPQ